MNIKITTEFLVITTENEQDKAYIRDTLGLKNPGDTAKVILHNPGDFDDGYKELLIPRKTETKE